jgi:hypothetical protein
VYEEAKFLRKLERTPIAVSRDSNPNGGPSSSLVLVPVPVPLPVVESLIPNPGATVDQGSDPNPDTSPSPSPLPNNIVMEIVDEPEPVVSPTPSFVADAEPSDKDLSVLPVPSDPTVLQVPSVTFVPIKLQTSFFAWSEISQSIQSIATFQYVMFEKTPFIKVTGGWSTTVEQGYTSPTHFIVPADGVYSIAYKVDVRSTNISGLITSVDSATVLTKNGEQIGGSASLVEFPLGNRQYMISNTVMVEASMGDKIALLFWSNDIGMRVGYPAFLTGALPGTAVVPIEACASIAFTHQE